MKAMAGLNQQLARSGLEKSLVELVRLRASQINGCAHCIDMHTADARTAGEGERRLATLAMWRETAFVNDCERAALEWTASVTRVAVTRVPDDVWERVQLQYTPAELVDLTLLVVTIDLADVSSRPRCPAFGVQKRNRYPTSSIKMPSSPMAQLRSKCRGSSPSLPFRSRSAR